MVMDKAWHVEHADTTTAIGRIDQEFDCVITDPPYSSGGLHKASRTNRPPTEKYSGAVDPGVDFDGDNRDQRSMTVWATMWMTEAYNLCRDGASFLCFTDWRQYPIMTDAVQAAGWVWRGSGVWAKPKGKSRPTKGGFWNDTEHILWATKGPVSTGYVPYLDGVFQYGSPGKEERKHPTEKPVNLLKDLVKICPPGGIVFDPFAGSGTTGVAALLEGRRFWGMEKNEHYFGVACSRLANLERGAGMDAPAEQMTLADVAMPG